MDFEAESRKYWKRVPRDRSLRKEDLEYLRERGVPCLRFCISAPRDKKVVMVRDALLVAEYEFSAWMPDVVYPIVLRSNGTLECWGEAEATIVSQNLTNFEKLLKLYYEWVHEVPTSPGFNTGKRSLLAVQVAMRQVEDSAFEPGHFWRGVLGEFGAFDMESDDDFDA